MKINRIKGLVWVAALGVGGYLVQDVWGFLQEKPELEKMLSKEKQKSVLDNVETPAVEERHLVDVNRVNAVFREMDWTGKPPPPPPPPPTNSTEKVEVPKIAVADMLKVLYTQAHASVPEESGAFVKYTGILSSANEELDDRVLRVGHTLPKPQHAVVVKDITVDGVIFAFPEDDGREPEVVPSLEYDDANLPGIVQLAPGQAPVMFERGTSGIRIGDPKPFRPGRTQQIGKNEWQIGTRDLEDVGQDYARIFSEDLRYRNHRNPKTGKIDGIQITDVAAGSIPANHGVTRGEVLKSINGHTVTSVNGAIAYVKANSETTDTWVAVFEKQGKEYSRVYRSPPR